MFLFIVMNELFIYHMNYIYIQRVQFIQTIQTYKLIKHTTLQTNQPFIYIFTLVDWTKMNWNQQDSKYCRLGLHSLYWTAWPFLRVCYPAEKEPEVTITRQPASIRFRVPPLDFYSPALDCPSACSRRSTSRLLRAPLRHRCVTCGEALVSAIRWRVCTSRIPYILRVLREGRTKKKKKNSAGPFHSWVPSLSCCCGSLAGKRYRLLAFAGHHRVSNLDTDLFFSICFERLLLEENTPRSLWKQQKDYIIYNYTMSDLLRESSCLYSLIIFYKYTFLKKQKRKIKENLENIHQTNSLQ